MGNCTTTHGGCSAHPVNRARSADHRSVFSSPRGAVGLGTAVFNYDLLLLIEKHSQLKVQHDPRSTGWIDNNSEVNTEQTTA